MPDVSNGNINLTVNVFDVNMRDTPGMSRTQTHRKSPARPYHHGDLRRALLESAGAALAANGPHLLSLRDVSRSAGVSHSAAYRHFPNKESLLAALAEAGFQALAQSMQQARDDPAAAGAAGEAASADLRQALARVGAAYVAFGIEHPALLLLMFGGQTGRPGDYPDLDQASVDAYAVLRELIEQGQQAGEFRSGDPALLALAAWSLVHGLSLLYAGDRVGAPDQFLPPSDQVGQAMYELLLGGIGTARP